MQQALIQFTPPCACTSGHKPQLCSYSLPVFSGLHNNGKLLGSTINNMIFQRHRHSQALSISRSRPVSAIPISCKIATISQDSFTDEVINSDVPVLVGFCADWCGPCKLIGPIMDSVTKDFEGKLKAVKIDTDSCPDLVKDYDVYGLPTLILFKDGKEVPKSRREGTITAKKLKELLDEVLTTATSA